MDQLLEQCGPRIIDVSASNDGSLTKATITGMTPDRLVALKDDAIAESMMYRQLTVSRMTGVKESNLFDLLMSRLKNIQGEVTKQSIGKGKSYFLPYILREQEDFVNANNFEITAGVADPDAGTTVDGVYHPRGSRLITVQSKALGSGADAKLSFDATGIKNIGRYFLIGESIVVLSLGAGNVAIDPHFEIIASASAVEGAAEVAKVVVKPNRTEGWWDAADAGAKAPYEVTKGIAIIGANSVSDYENWCENQPVDHSVRLAAFWPQTCRFTRVWDEEYEKYVERIFKGEVNVYLEKFKELPLAEQNKRQYATYRQKLMNSIFYGQAINEKQSVEGYKDLPKVYDPRNLNSFIEYKSRCLGIRTQLAACDRRVDYEGQPLNMNVLEEQCYALKRFREVDGGSVDSIDVMTDKGTARRIKNLMSDYYKKRYGMSWQTQFKQGEKIKFGDQTMWEYNSYELDDAQVTLNVIVDPYFTDNKAAFAGASGSIGTRGNVLWFIDWDDIEVGMGEFNSRKTEQPNEDDPDFRCTLKMNHIYTEMESCTITPIVNDGKRHLIVENFSDACPIYTYDACVATEAV